MSLPPGVSIGQAGSRQFVTQRGYYTPPFTSCMFAALCTILTWMGYRLPLSRKKDNTPPENFVLALHRASDAPLNQATDIRQSRRALRALLPDAEVKSGLRSGEELLDELDKGAAIRVMATIRDLPTHLQRWSPGGGAHAFCIIGKRTCNGESGGERHTGHSGVLEVFWMDPMGRPKLGYEGEWVPWQDVRPHLRRRDGEILVTLGYRDSAVRPVFHETVSSAIAGGALAELFELVGFRGKVGDKTPVLHPQNLTVVTRISATERARCLGPTPDGRHFAILVNTTKLPGPNPKLLFVEAGLVQRSQ